MGMEIDDYRALRVPQDHPVDFETLKDLREQWSAAGEDPKRQEEVIADALDRLPVALSFMVAREWKTEVGEDERRSIAPLTADDVIGGGCGLSDRQPPTEPANRTRAPITPAVPPPPVADSPGARAIAPRELRDTAPTRPLADPTPPDPGARPAPRPGQLVDSLKARAEKANVGLLRIRGLAGGAKLYIDGKLQTRLSHTLPVGPHVIRVERDGYETFERRVEIKAGEATRVRVMQSRRDD